MTAQSPPYALQASSHSAQLFRQAISTLMGSAGGVVDTGDYAVTQNGTPNMTVNVAGGVPGGRIWVPGQTAPGVQGLYYGFNDATVNLAIAASNPTNPRIDIVTARVQDAQYTGAVNSFSLAVVTGTPAGSPVAPSAPASSLVLANVAVAANATTVVTGNITDQRLFMKGPAALEGALSSYKAIEGHGIPAYAGFTSSIAAGTYPMPTGSGFPVIIGGSNQPFYFNPADYTVAGRTLKLRVDAQCIINGVAPAMSATIGFYPITFGNPGSGNQTIGGVGTLVPGSTVTFTTPGANSSAHVDGTDFTAPAAGYYGLCVVTTGAPASTSFVNLYAYLKYHQV